MRTDIKICVMREVENFIKLCFSVGFTKRDILNLLAHQHQDIVSFVTLKTICKKLFILKEQVHRLGETHLSFGR